MSTIVLDSVYKKFGTREILKGAAFSADEGEIIGLLGRNGSGKSTLLKILFGIVKADDSFLKIGNTINPGKYFCRKHINYLPQHDFLPNHLSLEKLLKVSLSPESFQKLKKHPRIRKNLNNKSDQISGGERRFIEILWTIHQAGNVLLLDEPFNGLSPILREEIIDTLRDISKDKAIILTDHDYQNVLHIATHVLLLKSGTTFAVAGKRDLITYGYLPPE